jgi:hypothetical protein
VTLKRAATLMHVSEAEGICSLPQDAGPFGRLD